MAYYGCLLTRSAAQTIPNNSIEHVSFDTELHDVGGFHSAAPYPERITIPTGLGGYYLIHGQIQWEVAVSGIRKIEIWVSGTVIARIQRPTISGGSLTQQILLPYYIAAAGYVVLYAFQDSGGDLDVERSAAPYTPLFGVDYLGS
jgi:hypothetical protein